MAPRAMPIPSADTGNAADAQRADVRISHSGSARPQGIRTAAVAMEREPARIDDAAFAMTATTATTRDDPHADPAAAAASRVALGLSAVAGWSAALLAVPALASDGRRFALAALLAGGLGSLAIASAWAWPTGARARCAALLGPAAVAAAILWGWCAALLCVMP